MLPETLIARAGSAYASFARKLAVGAILLLFTLSSQVHAANAVTTLHAFTSAEGGFPSRLVQASDGNYYGTAATGGAIPGNSGAGYGTVFQMTPGGTVTILHSFSGIDGSGPTGLVVGPDGDLYGTTQSGGANNGGSVFKITVTGTFATLYSFPQNSFSEAVGPGRLTLGTDGNFYGTTGYGGDNACGSVFRVTPSGALSTLYSFPSQGGPGAGNEGLLLARDGSFYGVTSLGPAVFKITTTGVVTTVHRFTTGEGFPTRGALVQGADDTLYGTTSTGGAQGAGTVFSVSSAGVLTTLYSFSPTQGAITAQPGALTDGGDGSFYGSIQFGGETLCACGAIFKIAPSGVLSMMYYFAGPPDSFGPKGSLMRGTDGYLYGATSTTIYRYDSSLPPPPFISIAASPKVITVGNSAMLTWSSTSATSCTGSNAWSGAIATSGSQSVTPTTTGPSGFTLTCTGAGGDAIASAVLNVNPSPAISLALTPSAIGVGDTALLSWTNSATSTTCTASGAWSGIQPAAGSQQVSPSSAGSYTYNLSCPSAAGDTSVNSSATLTVTYTPRPPTISFSASASAIVLGQGSTLTWSATDATSCSAANAWTGSLATTGKQTMFPSSSGTYQYDLTCIGPVGSTTASVSLLVTQSAPPPVTLPTVTISLNPVSITLGQSASLSWSSSNATTCSGTNAWSGSLSSSGTQVVTPSAIGSYTYVLTCNGSGGATSSSTKLDVSPAPSSGISSGSDPNSSGGPTVANPSPEKGGGGAFGFEDLAGLALLFAFGRRPGRIRRR